MHDTLRRFWARVSVAFAEALSFYEVPSAINGIEDASGRIVTVQAPALRLLKPGEPQVIRIRFVSKGHTGSFSGFGDGAVRRRVVRRDCGVVPHYYFT